MSKWKFRLHRFSMAMIFAAFVFITMLLSMLLVTGIVSVLMHYRLIDYPQSSHQPVFFFSIISLIVASIMAIFFSHRPLKPLYALKNAADQIASGNYSVRVQVKGPKDVQNLFISFNHMAEELGSVEMLRTDFINNFSHEFKTPIVSIRGFAKMLQRNDLTEEERKEYINIIFNESDRLTDLASNVLNLSKIKKQTILTGKKRYNVSEQIRLVIAMMIGKWSNKNIDFSFESDEIYLIGNEELLKQVWINLLDNSIKFSPESVSVEVKIIQNSYNTLFFFSDQGMGIPEKKSERIFEQFYQGDTSHTAPGNGLGLTISKQIIELHNGTIQIDKTNHSGTSFKISIPIQKDADTLSD